MRACILLTMVQLYQRYFENIILPENNRGENALNLFHSIVLSWPFVIVKFFTEFILSYFFLDQMTENILEEGKIRQIFELFSDQSLKYGFLVLFLSSFFTMIFFPLWGVLGYYFWRVLFNFYFWFMKIEDKDEVNHEIICASFGSYSFYAIPIIGELATTLGRFYILFLGLKRRVGLSAWASLLILCTPPFLFGFVFLSTFVFMQLMFG